jgi:cell division cycle protein 37
MMRSKLDFPALIQSMLEKKSLETDIPLLMETIQKRQELIKTEIENEEQKINSNITTENLKTGFDKTVVSKKQMAAAAAESSSTKTIETIHDPSKAQANNLEKLESADDDDDEADYITYQPAVEFAKLSTLETSFSYLGKHPELATQKYSDEVMAEAFRLEMDGKSNEAKVCIHQSLILQYCGLLGKDGIAMFFKR